MTCNLQALLEQAKTLKDAFETRVLRPLAMAAGPDGVWLSNLKQGPRIMEKIKNDYGGDASLLKDLLRGSILCTTLRELLLVCAALQRLADEGVIRICQVKNRFRDAGSAG